MWHFVHLSPLTSPSWDLINFHQSPNVTSITNMWLHATSSCHHLSPLHSCSNYAKNQTVYKKSIALLLRRYWFSSDDVKMKFVYFFMLSKIEVLTFPKKNIFYHFEVHLRSKGSENGYIANIEYLHLNCPNFPKLSCFMVFAHTRTQ